MCVNKRFLYFYNCFFFCVSPMQLQIYALVEANTQWVYCCYKENVCINFILHHNIGSANAK